MSKSKSARAQFTPRENGPERLVAEAEIHFEDGPLAGMRLVGFSALPACARSGAVPRRHWLLR
jgi:hypothetical protein